VPTGAAASRPFGVRTRLVLLAGFATYGVGLSALYASTGVGLPCPFRMVTGWQCPLCGGTRLGAALLNGDVADAFAANPLVLLGLALLTVLGALWTIEAAGGPAARLPGGVARALGRVRPNHLLLLGVLGSLVYVLLRNLL